MIEDFNLGDSGRLHIWYMTTGGSDLDTGAFLDITSSLSGVIQFTAAETYDFTLLLAGAVPLGPRWGDSFGANGTVGADSVLGLNAFSVSSGSGMLSSQTPPNPIVDTGFDVGADAFLFGSVDFDVVGLGTTVVSTAAGGGGIVHNGSIVNPTFRTATINVVPEPSLLALVGLGLGGVMGRRRRRC